MSCLTILCITIVVTSVIITSHNHDDVYKQFCSQVITINMICIKQFCSGEWFAEAALFAEAVTHDSTLRPALPQSSAAPLGRALGHFVFSRMGLKRILFTNIFQRP